MLILLVLLRSPVRVRPVVVQPSCGRVHAFRRHFPPGPEQHTIRQRRRLQTHRVERDLELIEQRRVVREGGARGVWGVHGEGVPVCVREGRVVVRRRPTRLKQALETCIAA